MKAIKQYFSGQLAAAVCLSVYALWRGVWRSQTPMHSIMAGVIILCAACTFTTEPPGDFKWRKTADGAVIITDYRGEAKEVDIPIGLDGKRVTGIGPYAFNTKLLTGVVIPASVKSIGEGAFRDNKLLSVIIPASVTHIGAQAFSANQLTHVTIGAGVIIEDANAFDGNFKSVYDGNEQKAGTYKKENGSWNY